MKWDNLFESGAKLLNQNVLHINNRDISINIHYWGAESFHYNNKPHQHSFFELCYIVNGRGQYIDRNNIYDLNKETLFLSRPFIKHQILSDIGLDILFVAFEINPKKTQKKFNDFFHSLTKTDKFIFPKSKHLALINLWTSILILSNEQFINHSNSFNGLCSTFFLSLYEKFSTHQK